MIELIFSIKILEASKKVLLIDLVIVIGNIDLLIGNSSPYSLADLFSHSKTFHDIIEIGPKGLAYIAGGNSFVEFLELSDEQLDYFHHQFEWMQSTYDFIIFDLGVGATHTSMSFV